ncbi:isocitrate dehydrogenase [Pantoea sp. GbtcB22]|uniref:isocitrate dehydrogenase n=1 Tax=Pantoea sp. GbtcB22 TaxID=2824767 RepID=UPI001C3083A8|nr:isocitrate dehydrogenase [Pantoea sp. GbtcB22]
MKLFIKNLTVIDFSYLDAERGIVGNSLIVDVVFTGSLNEQNMVMDFSLAKKTVKASIDELTDHVLIVPVRSKVISIIESKGRKSVSQKNHNNMIDILIDAPVDSFCLLDCEQVNIMEVEDYLTKMILPKLPNEVTALSIKLRKESTNSELYHYTHGLKKHDGNCQRIAHGHASQISIFVDGVRSKEWEQYWINRWRDIYLASEEDVIQHEKLSDSVFCQWHPELIAMQYLSSQGNFEMMINKNKVDMLPCDTTVENLARFIKDEMLRMAPFKDIEIHAYEGIDKGAIA